MSLTKNQQPLSLVHLEELNALWKPLCSKNHIQYAEFSFANAFLFRRQHNYVFIPGSGTRPFIRGEFSNGQHYYIPTDCPKEEDLLELKGVEAERMTLFPVLENWLTQFKDFYPEIESLREDSDYLFSKDKLRTMGGNSLSSRRNLMHQFESQHEVKVTDLMQENIPDAKRVLDAWLEHSGGSKEKTDYLSCLDAFEYLERLQLFGRIVYADGLPVGFTIGELLTPQTALLHLSKTIHSYKGVTPFLYQDFAKQLPESVEWINLEQDLGILSLRKAKEAYEPDTLLAKYRVSFVDR